MTGIIWFVRAWIVVLVVSAALTASMLLSGCASWHSSDCRRGDNGVWRCHPK